MTYFPVIGSNAFNFHYDSKFLNVFMLISILIIVGMFALVAFFSYDGEKIRRQKEKRERKAKFDLEEQLRYEERRKRTEERIQRGEIPPPFRTYDDYLSSRWWKNMRDHTLKWLDHTCEFCGLRANQIHHVRYFKRRDRWGTESITMLVAVCENCHSILHGKTGGKSPNACTFCNKPARKGLEVKIKKYESSTPVNVCFRCSKLSQGYRDSAYGWSDEKYAEWRRKWRETMPIVKPN